MNQELQDRISKRSDEDLINMVYVDREGYQPLAVIAAEEEIKKRKIDAGKIDQVIQELKTKIDEKNELDSKKLSSGTRIIHFIVDFIAIIILTEIYSILLGFFINNTVQIEIKGYVLILIAFFSYYIFMETKYQKTFGKFITKTKVVNFDQTKPNLESIIKRTICRFIPIDPISFLFADNGFHDRFSETMVIKDAD